MQPFLHKFLIVLCIISPRILPFLFIINSIFKEIYPMLKFKIISIGFIIIIILFGFMILKPDYGSNFAWAPQLHKNHLSENTEMNISSFNGSYVDITITNNTGGYLYRQKNNHVLSSSTVIIGEVFLFYTNTHIH